MCSHSKFQRMLSVFLTIAIVLSGVVISPSIDRGIKFGKKVSASTSCTWKQKADLPSWLNKRRLFTTMNGKLYLLCEGRNARKGDACDIEMWEYNPKTDTWVQKQQNRMEFYDGRLIVHNDMLYKFHDFIVDVYDPKTEEWKSVATSWGYGQWDNGTAVTIGDEIYCFGGYSKNSEGQTYPNNHFESYNPITDKQITKHTDFSISSNLQVALNNKIYFFGGFGGYINHNSSYKNLLEYDLITDTWIEKERPKDLDYIESRHAKAFAANNKIYVMYPYSYGGEATKILEYDPLTNKWTKIQDTSFYKCPDSVVIGNKIYALNYKEGPQGKYIGDNWYSLDNLELWEGTITDYPLYSTVSPKVNEIISDQNTNFIPQISVSDINNNPLTCKYYIDSETTPRDTKVATNTSGLQTVSFDPLNMGTLSEGNHTIKFEVTDGEIPSPIIKTVDFKVDKTNPTVGTVTRSSTVNSITVSGSGTDAMSGLDANPYRYTIGTETSEWMNAATYTSSRKLEPNTQYETKFEVKDATGHIAGNTKNCYTKALVPEISVENAASYSLDAVISDENPIHTEYQIAINGSQYVTQEGTLTAAPSWISLTNKKITVTGLNPNKTYQFTAKARNGENVETVASVAASGTTMVSPPGSPANIIATATDKTITLSWDAVSDATGYEVEADGKTSDAGMATTYKQVGLYAGTPHTFRVRAKNEGGPGNWSSPISKTTLPVSPGIPSNLNVIPLNTSVTVVWGSVPGATSYDIEVDGVQVENGPNTNYIHNSLTPGTHHSYRVRSVNAGGKSEWSEPVKATTQQNSAQVPVNVIAELNQNSIILSWNTVSGATGYDVEVDGVIFDNGARTKYTHSNLVPGTRHAYRVRAKQDGVNSDWSSVLAVSTMADSFGTPLNFKANADHSSVTLSWDPVPDAAGYDVEIDGVVSDNEDSITCVHSGLAPNSSHTYRVRARSANDTSEWTSKQDITLFALPTPENVKADAEENAITVSWDAVGGAASYEVEFDDNILKTTETNSTSIGLEPNSEHTIRVRAIGENGNGNWSIPLVKSTAVTKNTVPAVSGIAKKTSIKVMWNEIEGATAYEVEADGQIKTVSGSAITYRGLEPGTKHTYRVRAVQDKSSGGWSKVFTISTLTQGPATPTNVTTSSTMTSILVTWDKVAGAKEYEIEVDGKTISIGAGTGYLHKGLSPDATHTYRIRAINTSGTSGWTALKKVKTVSSVQKYNISSEEPEEEFDLAFSALNIQDLDKYTFTIQYKPEDLELVDLCGFTSKPDTVEGDVTGTDITVKQINEEEGTVVFVRTGSAQTWQTWSGIVNSIRFKAKREGDTVITYTIQ